MFSAAETDACRRLVDLALEEDLGADGDLTSQAVIPPDLPGRAAVAVGRRRRRAARRTTNLRRHRSELSFRRSIPDGSAVRPARLAVVSGRMRSILAGERTALNFVQRLSGVATQTARYVEAVAGLPCQVLDTRKTTPGWRLLEKYAVRCGGGHNHRMGLDDGVLIKDNHLAAVGGGPPAVAEAVRLARAQVRITLPAGNRGRRPGAARRGACGPAGHRAAGQHGAGPAARSGAPAERNGADVQLEASGGVTLATLRAIAETGVDRVSVGALTHSACARHCPGLSDRCCLRNGVWIPVHAAVASSFFDSRGQHEQLCGRLADDPANDGVAVLAAEQTAGRGQHGGLAVPPRRRRAALGAALPAAGAAPAGGADGLGRVAVCETVRRPDRIAGPHQVAQRRAVAAGRCAASSSSRAAARWSASA